MGKEPLEVGVPLRTPVEELKVTPEGRLPDWERVGAGEPVVVTVKEPREPRTKVALLALVMAGAWFTVSVKFCVAADPTPLLAVIVMGKMPAVPAAGVPLKVAVPFPLFVNVRVAGNAPVSPKVGAGTPEATKVYVPAIPTTKGLGLLELGIVGAEDSGCVGPDCPPPPQPARLSPSRAERKRMPGIRPGMRLA